MTRQPVIPLVVATIVVTMTLASASVAAAAGCPTLSAMRTASETGAANDNMNGAPSDDDSLPPNLLLAGIGLGAGNLGYPAGTVTIAWGCGRQLLGLRGAIDGTIFGNDVWDLALLYGFVERGDGVLASASIGPALVGGDHRHGIFSTSESIPLRPGIALEARLFWYPFHAVGFGAYGFADLNSERHMAAITGSLQLLFDW